MSDSLDTDQARHFVRSDLSTNCLQRLSADDRNFVGPDLGTNCLQRLSADDKSCHYWGKS